MFETPRSAAYALMNRYSVPSVGSAAAGCPEHEGLNGSGCVNHSLAGIAEGPHRTPIALGESLLSKLTHNYMFLFGNWRPRQDSNLRPSA